MPNKKVNLPFRHVHLDYHTSELMKNVGGEFNKKEFVTTLKKAHVNSICCFARCHHGYLYYPSKLFPERIHPQLANKNLLLEQVEACKEAGIRIPVYVTVQWDHFSAMDRSDWLMRDEKGQLVEQMFSPGFYRYLCINTSYRDFLKAHVKEICEMAPNHDGFFFDILWAQPCCCPACREKMEAKGLDYRKPEDRKLFGEMSIRDFTDDMTAFVHEINSEYAVYYNSGNIDPENKTHLKDFTHLEFDALPSGHGDYNDFPIVTRTNRTYGYDYAGHTGKFHTGWGDVHSYKNQAALEYECFMLMALGGKCIVGDQLHPLGQLDQVSYELIGRVFSQIEKKESWCEGVEPVVEIGVYYTQKKALTGVHKILKEAGYQYDIIGLDSDFSRYKVIVLADRVVTEGDLLQKLRGYLSEGGKIFATFLSGVNEEGSRFELPLGVKMLSDREIDVDGKAVRGQLRYRKEYTDYVIPRGNLGKGLPETEHVMYVKANEVEVGEGGQVLLETTAPPFYRDMAHFCSHVQAPSYGDKGTAAAIGTDQSLYLAFNLFELYDELGPKWCKQFVINGLDLLLEQRIVRHTGPSTMEAIINEQPAKERYVLHILHYVPIKRAEQLEIIEDVYPLYDVKMVLQLEKKIRTIKLQPENKPLDFKYLEDGGIELLVPYFKGHQLIEFDYSHES